MICKDISFKDPIQNILYEEALLQVAQKINGQEVLRFWESEELFVVLGRICKKENDCREEALRADHIPLLRRTSGGGTVLQGKGCLNYSLVLSKKNPEVADLRKSYQYILSKVVDALRVLGVQSQIFPVSDIALSGNAKKISGNAQKRTKDFILHHGTILIDFDLSLIEKYLKMPQAVPLYRQGRSHVDFCSNVLIDKERFKSEFKRMFHIDRTRKHMDSDDKQMLSSLSPLEI